MWFLIIIIYIDLFIQYKKKYVEGSQRFSVIE